MTKIAVYAGTFDPITKGHVDLIERATKLFDRVIVAVADNTKKHPAFGLDQRLQLAQHAVSHLNSVEVEGFNGLLYEFAEQEGAAFLLRGLRNVSDFEYEFQMAGMNRHYSQQLETVFLMPGDAYLNVSSSLIREIAACGGDVSEFVTEAVVEALKDKYK